MSVHDIDQARRVRLLEHALGRPVLTRKALDALGVPAPSGQTVQVPLVDLPWRDDTRDRRTVLR